MARIDDLIDKYSQMNQDIIRLFIQTLTDDLPDGTQAEMLKWQLDMLNKQGVLTDQLVELVSDATGSSERELKWIINDSGQQARDETGKQLLDIGIATGMVALASKSKSVDDVASSFIEAAFGDMNDKVTNPLMANLDGNPALADYRKLVTDTVDSVISGLDTPDVALRKAIYKLIDKGVSSGLVDAAGRQWSIEAYSRMVLETTLSRVQDEIRFNDMMYSGVETAMMSSHPASRVACAGIQGHWVYVRPSKPGDEYESIYSHGYGFAWGTKGVNCHHRFYPGIPGINENHMEQYDPKEAIKNGKLQAKQRALERKVRVSKQKKMAAEQLEYDDDVQRFNLDIRKYQSAIRQHVDQHDFLYRDYSRERVSATTEKVANDLRATKTKHSKQYENLKDELGSHGLPNSLEEYRKVLYNRHSSKVLNAYVSARRRGSVEAVVNYDDYVIADKKLNSQIVGMKTANGSVINGFSDHTLDRVFGVQKDGTTKTLKRRDGVSINSIKDILDNGEVKPGRDGATKYLGTNGYVVVNAEGKIITVVPHTKRRK